MPTDTDAQSATDTEPPQAPARKPWVTPEIVRMRAGDAEQGPTPNHPEGPLGFGDS